MRRAAVLLLLAACTGGSSSEPGDAAPADSADFVHQLGVSWQAVPPIPGPVAGTTAVTTASFNIRRVQVIGDASGGAETVKGRLQLLWAGGVSPPATPFPDAPSGLYSKVAFDLEGQGMNGVAYEITGTALLDGAPAPFVVRDAQPLAIEVAGFAVSFSPGEDVALPVALDLTPALARLDVSEAPEVEGVRVVDATSPQIAAVRDGLALAFVPAR